METASWNLKQARLNSAGPPAAQEHPAGSRAYRSADPAAERVVQRILLPTRSDPNRPRFGYKLIVGGLYNPITRPLETWINIACMSQDPRVAFDEEKFGFRLVRVHAVVYETRLDGSLNWDTPISTIDTSDSDEAICNLKGGVDTSFITIPRTFRPGFVALLSVGRDSQHIEVTENVERALPR